MTEELIEPKNNPTTIPWMERTLTRWGSRQQYKPMNEEDADTLGLRAAVQTNGLQVLEVTTHQLHLLPLWVHCA